MDDGGGKFDIGRCQGRMGLILDQAKDVASFGKIRNHAGGTA